VYIKIRKRDEREDPLSSKRRKFTSCYNINKNA